LRSLKSVNRTLLTGTPLQNDIRELWALFNFLMPELFRDIEGFSSLLELEDMKVLMQFDIITGPDFKSWSQIGGAAQMCSYLCPTH
jgi:hypothetical protein